MTDDSEQERWTDEDKVAEQMKQANPKEWSDRKLASRLENMAAYRSEYRRKYLREAASRLRGGEGERLREVKSWETTRVGAGVEMCASCRMQVGERHQEDCDFAHRPAGRPERPQQLRAVDAASDTEGREEWQYELLGLLAHVRGGGPDLPEQLTATGEVLELAKRLRRAHPEEAGGEDEALADRVEMAAAELKAEIRDRYHADHEDGIHPAQQGKYEAAMELVEDLHRAADRLRGAPEGAGEETQMPAVAKLAEYVARRDGLGTMQFEAAEQKRRLVQAVMELTADRPNDKEGEG